MSDTVAGDVGLVGLHHCAVATTDLDRARAFYVDLIGLKPHETKPHWLMAGTHGAVHLMKVSEGTRAGAAGTGTETAAYHVALEVRTLEPICARMVSAGISPFQLNFEGQRRDIHELDSDLDLDWGLGTLFVFDPDGNCVEFLQTERGIFKDHDRADMALSA